MAGELNLSALRDAGAAILAAPAPAVPELEPWAEDLRCRFDAGYAEDLEVRLGLRRPRGYGYGTRRPRGGVGHDRYLCFDCRHFVAGKYATCKVCGYQHGGMNHDAEAV